MARGLDHIVWAVRKIEAASRFLERIGFTLTPLARHPWGTCNKLIQLDGAFLEILSLDEPSSIAEAEPDGFSFGAFNRDFPAGREGGSMLALESRDPAADRTDFEQHGMRVYSPFSFERIAKSPKGIERKVAFDLTFTQDPVGVGLGYFTCFNRYPENFWQQAFQTHANGAVALDAVVFVMDEPADHHIFFSNFAGVREMRVTSLGIEIATPRGLIRIVTPRAYRLLYGTAAFDALGETPALAAVQIAVSERDRLTEGLNKAGVVFEDTLEGSVIPASKSFGLSLAFNSLQSN